MKFLVKVYLLIGLIICANSVFAQEKLSLQQAISIALENNYSIKLSKNNSTMSSNDVSLGNAGFLPSLTGNLTDINQVQTSKVDLASGQTREAINAATSNLSYGVNFNWKIFDGFQMFANYKSLKELEKLGGLNARLAVQNTVADVISTYYQVVTLEKQYKAVQTALDVSILRRKNENSRYTIGKGSKLDLLAARVDFNTDTTQLLGQEDLIRSAKIRLNDLLTRDANTQFSVEEDLKIDTALKYETLSSMSLGLNVDLQRVIINQQIAKFNLQQLKGNRYPSLSLTSGYNFQNSTSPPTGFALRTNVKGFNYGLTATFNIFNGFQQNRIEKNAKLEIDNASLQLDQARQTVTSALLNAYQTYQTNIKLIGLEEKNIEIAQENLNITLEKYRLGSIVPLELREAQKNFLDASVRYSNALYQAKLSEVSIGEITGKITL
jgi:outer membrane protein